MRLFKMSNKLSKYNPNNPTTIKKKFKNLQKDMKFLKQTNPSTSMTIIMTTKVLQVMNFQSPKHYSKVPEDMKNLKQYNIVQQENMKFITKYTCQNKFRMKTQ